MGNFEHQPDFSSGGEYEGSGELLDALISHAENGGAVRIFIDMEINDGSLQQKIDELREAGAIVIVPQDN